MLPARNLFQSSKQADITKVFTMSSNGVSRGGREPKGRSRCNGARRGRNNLTATQDQIQNHEPEQSWPAPFGNIIAESKRIPTLIRDPPFKHDLGWYLREFTLNEDHKLDGNNLFLANELREVQKAALFKYFTRLNIISENHPQLQHINNLNYLKDSILKVALRSNILFCIDVEAYEFNQQTITEIGIAIYDPSSQQGALFPNVKTIHIIVEEFQNKRNGKYVEDNKDKFLAGKSLVLPLNEAVKFVNLLVYHYFEWIPTSQDLGCVLVGHDLRGDVAWFKKIGINFPENLQQLDTQKIWSATHGTTAGTSLSRLLRFLDIPHTYLHNAANDAYYTLLLCMNICDPHSRFLSDLDTDDDDPTPLRKLAKGEITPEVPKGGSGRNGRKKKKGSGYDIMGKVYVKTYKEAIFETFCKRTD